MPVENELDKPAAAVKNRFPDLCAFRTTRDPARHRLKEHARALAESLGRQTGAFELGASGGCGVIGSLVSFSSWNSRPGRLIRLKERSPGKGRHPLSFFAIP